MWSRKEQNSSVAATNPGPLREGHRQARLRLHAQFKIKIVNRRNRVCMCRRAIPLTIHTAHTTSSARLAPNRPSQPLLSLGSSSSSLSNIPIQPPPTHRRVPLTHAPNRTAAHQGHKPPHASTGVGRDKLGRKIAGELLCLVKIQHSRKRLKKPLRAVLGRGVGC